MKALTLILLSVIFSAIVVADWQQTLNENFDIVDTFDNLDDWTPEIVGQPTIYERPADFTAFTNRTDGGMIWQQYNIYRLADQPAIMDHGSDNTWAYGGASNATRYKSLCIDFNLDYNDVTLGTQRLVYQTNYSGNQLPSSGYNEVYFFMMIKLPYGYENCWFDDGEWKLQDEDGFDKIFFLATGFNSIDQWGTTEQYDDQVACDAVSQATSIYGSSGFLFAQPTHGVSTLNDLRGSITFGVHDTSTYCGYAAVNLNDGCVDSVGDYNWSRMLCTGQWHAWETRYKLSDPPGTANGAIQFWVYDENGNMVYNRSCENIVTMYNSNDLDFSDHTINKLEIGGNRQDGTGYANEWYGTHTGPDSDSVIVDSSADLSDVLVGKFLWNTDDLSWCRVASSTETTCTCDAPLTGGTNNTFRTGDSYEVTDFFGPVEHYYVDDIILDSDRIAPSYFSLLNFSADCQDDDNDGYGFGCILGNDCNDSDALVNSNRTCVYDGFSCGTYSVCSSTCSEPPKDICDNGFDEDCDGLDDDVSYVQYLDLDGDGFGNSSSSVFNCSEVEGYVVNGSDCNDQLASAYPGAPEVCRDGIDQDCDGFDLTVCPSYSLRLDLQGSGDTTASGYIGLEDQYNSTGAYGWTNGTFTTRDRSGPVGDDLLKDIHHINGGGNLNFVVRNLIDGEYNVTIMFYDHDYSHNCNLDLYLEGVFIQGGISMTSAVLTEVSGVVNVNDSDLDIDFQGVVGSLPVAGIIVESVYIHDADTDEDGTISTVEVRAYHTLWKTGIVSLTELIDVLQIWKG